MSEPRIASFADFWPYYLREHSRPACRALHYAASIWALVWLAVLLATGNPWSFVTGLVGGYALAWIGHFFVEHNRPATFKYPLWSLAADWKMFAVWLSGRLPGELAAAGVAAEPEKRPA